MKQRAAKTAIVSREEIVAGFYAWISTSRLSDFFSLVSEKPHVTKIVDDSLSEILEINSHAFDHWWMINHYRYRNMTEKERRCARECARQFVCEVQTGQYKLNPEAGKGGEPRAGAPLRSAAQGSP